jgi:hypothetical protein
VQGYDDGVSQVSKGEQEHEHTLPNHVQNLFRLPNEAVRLIPRFFLSFKEDPGRCWPKRLCENLDYLLILARAHENVDN